MSFSKAIAAIAAISLTSVPAMAANFGADGKYNFSGPVSIVKSLPSALPCDLDIEIEVSNSGADVVLSKAVLNGVFVCNSLLFPNLPNNISAVGLGGGAFEVTVSGVRVAIPPIGALAADACEGDLKFILISGSSSPSVPAEIILQYPLSVIDDDPGLGLPTECIIEGDLDQDPAESPLIVS